MSAILRTILGEYFPLARQLFRSTVMYLIFLVCIYVVRRVAAALFPENDFTSNLLHLADAYSTLVGVVGFVVWITLDMYLLVQQVRFNKTEDSKEDSNATD